MSNQWGRFRGTIDASESGSDNQSNLSVYQGHNMEKLLKELENERNLKEELRQRLEKADASLLAWQNWHESDKINRKQEHEEATTKIGIKLQDAEKTIEQLNSKCLELEKINQALNVSEQDEIRKSSALASTLEQEHKMFERIMSVWKQRVTSLQADIDNSEKECGRAQAELLKKYMKQQKSNHTATIRNNNTSDTSDIRDNNTPDTSDVPSPRKKLAKTSEKSHEMSEPENQSQIDETVPTQRKDESADGRHQTQTNGLISTEYYQNVHKRKTILNRRALVNPKRHAAKCKLCNSLFVSKRTLRVHMRKIHLRESNFSCDFCDKTFIWRHELALHRTKHTGELPYSCESCPKTFRTMAQLKKHNTTHSEERPYVCKVCTKRFKHRQTLYGHMKLHIRDRPHMCELCGKRFKNSQDLKRHMILHTDERPFACELCPKKFHTSGRLNFHKRIHSVKDPFKCEFCPRRYRTPQSRIRHEQNIHPTSLTYQCKICALGFRCRASQQKHRKTCSAGERPFKCSVCPRKFKLKLSRIRHEAAHSTAEPTHECEDCGRRFYEKQYLSLHQRVHRN